MPTRPPKARRQVAPPVTTSEVYRELSALLTEAGRDPLPTTIGGLSRKTGPVFREAPLTEALGSFADVKASIERARAGEGVPTLDFDALLMHQGMFGPIVPGDGTPPPLALSLNVSAEAPTLSTLDVE